MPTVISPVITDAGLAAAINMASNGLQLQITHVVIGTGKYNPGYTSVITNRTEKATIAGAVGTGAGAFLVSAYMPSFAGVAYNVSEIAFYAGDPDAGGVCFAIYSHPTEIMFQRNSLDWVGQFALQLVRVPAGSVGVVVDPQASLAVALLSQHLNDANPHPQYVKLVTLAEMGLFRAVRRQVFSTPGSYTYTPDPNMMFADVQIAGGGGGGGGAYNGANSAAAGSGGGAGATACKLLSAAVIGASRSVTIGAGGAGGTVSGGNGANGGTTSFGTLLSAPGGIGGVWTAGSWFTLPGGEGGAAASGGDVNEAGGGGGVCGGIYSSGIASFGWGGQGGSNRFGGGGLAGGNGNPGGNGGGWGAGGGGAGGGQYVSAAGGNGNGGVVIVTEYCYA